MDETPTLSSSAVIAVLMPDLSLTPGVLHSVRMTSLKRRENEKETEVGGGGMRMKWRENQSRHYDLNKG